MCANKLDKGSPIAIKAGARKIAEAYYNAIMKGMDYVEKGTTKYMEQLKKRELYALSKIAKKYNYTIIENQNFTQSCHW